MLKIRKNYRHGVKFCTFAAFFNSKHKNCIMKKGFIVMMLALAASAVVLPSCNKQDTGSGYLSADYDFFVPVFDMEVYDYTITYTDVKTGALVTKTMTEDNWIYKDVAKVSKLPEPFVLKIEGKLKPNAEQIIDDMIESGGLIVTSHGYVNSCSADLYEDQGCTVLKKNILSSKSTSLVDLTLKNVKTVLDEPVITVVDITK